MLLDAGEQAVADLGYRGEASTINLPKQGTENWELEMGEARARHETCNNRFKKWMVLQVRFRQQIDLHETCFTAVVVITQLQIQYGQPLFYVEINGDI